MLVNFGGRIGYANTLAEALDEVFGDRRRRGRRPTATRVAPTTPEDDGDATADADADAHTDPRAERRGHR